MPLLDGQGVRMLVFNMFPLTSAIEDRLGLGLSDDTITATDGTTIAALSIELDMRIGVYGVGQVPFGKSSSVYAIAGFSRVDGTG